MRHLFTRVLSIAVLAMPLALLGVAPAHAQEKIRIGIIASFSGPFAITGQNFKQGIDVFLAERGNKVGGREVEIIYRDVGASNQAASAKRHAEELVVREKVALIGGLGLSLEASAIASVINETKTPAVMFIAATSSIIRQSPYFLRVGSTIWQDGTAMAEAAYKSGKRRAYLATADFSAGHDLQAAFKARFTQLGGTIVGQDALPLNTVDFAPAVERVANAKPDFVGTFFPPGPQINLLKGLAGRGLLSKDTSLMGLANDMDLQLFDDSLVGFETVSFYSPSLDNPQNRKFTESLKKLFGDSAHATYVQVAAYDGMTLLYRMIETQQGKPFDGPAAVNAVRGFKWVGPRGEASVDPETREVVHNLYVRQLRKVGPRIENVVTQTFPNMKDPWHQANPVK